MSFACYESRVSIFPLQKTPPQTTIPNQPSPNQISPSFNTHYAIPGNHQRPTKDPPFHNASTNGTPHQITPQSPPQKQPFAISKKLRNFALESVIQQIQQINW